MPKYGNVFDSQLSFICHNSLREKLVALAYLRGDPGSYASTGRYLMEKIVEETIREMDTGERRKFDQILKNVKSETLVSKQMKQERFEIKKTRRSLYVKHPSLMNDPPREEETGE